MPFADSRFPADVDPPSLGVFFADISRIPRETGNERRVGEHIRSIAASHADWTHHTDDVGNVSIHIPAVSGCEHVPGVCLQAHSDMVCVKTPESTHDFERDPIPLACTDDWLHARDTSLGADNLGGLSVALALAESADLKRGPLDILVTVGEEKSGIGCMRFDPVEHDIRSTYLINLDCFDEDVLVLSCAGNQHIKATFPLRRQKPEKEGVIHDVLLSGLKGGHSGINITEERGNALLLLAKLLEGLPPESHLISLDGGTEDNVIPADARATICATDPAAWDRWLQKASDMLEGPDVKRFSNDIRLETRPSAAPVLSVPLTSASQRMLITTLESLPNGVRSMNTVFVDVPNLSSNVGNIRTHENHAEIGILMRSVHAEDMRELGEGICRTVEGFGGKAHLSAASSGWLQEEDAPLVRIAEKAHANVMGVSPRITGIHGWIEPAVLSKYFRSTIVMGMTIENAHTVNERLLIPSMERAYRRLRTTLEMIAESADL